MTKKLGFGCMRLPLKDAEDPASIDMARFCEMTDLFLSRGFTYFDTAYMYHKSESERAVKEALVKRHARDSYTLATKLPLSMIESSEEFLPKFEEQLEKTGVEYFDYYLLHNINGGTLKLVEEGDPFGFAMKLKAEGRIKKFGFSFHDSPELLDRLLTDHPETEFVQLQLNYVDWRSDTIQSRANYSVCVKHGKPVVVMEPVKGGLLASLPPEAMELLRARAPKASAPSWAIRFAASLPDVAMVLSGMSSLDQVEENTAFMSDFVPLDEGDMKALESAAEILTAETAIACTGCAYCTDGCPKHIPIPKYFSLYNALKRFDKKSNSGLYYRNEINRGCTPAKDCIACGACARLCPQHLAIPELMKEVSQAFDSQN
ncbi:MAG: aldo/keto reductase [Pyramidobacter sp.]|jgi:predicted aldo/keto reductase-like oxidoreductase